MLHSSTEQHRGTEKMTSLPSLQTMYETGVEDGRNDIATFLLELHKSNPTMTAEQIIQSAFAFKEAMKICKEKGE